MRSTGIVRKIDDLGRIVLPIELRRVIGVELGAPIEFYEDGRSIMMKVYQGYSCSFCGDAESNLFPFKGKLICASCHVELKPPPAPDPEVIKNIELKLNPAKRTKKSVMIDQLLELIRTHPKSTQTELGAMLGVTAGRVSQLCKELREQSKMA